MKKAEKKTEIKADLNNQHKKNITKSMITIRLENNFIFELTTPLLFIFSPSYSI